MVSMKDMKEGYEAEHHINDAAEINSLVEKHYTSENSRFNTEKNPGSKERNSKERDSGIREPK